MSLLYDLILQRKDELQSEKVQVVDAAQAWRLWRERYPHCIRWRCSSGWLSRWWA